MFSVERQIRFYLHYSRVSQVKRVKLISQFISEGQCIGKIIDELIM